MFQQCFSFNKSSIRMISRFKSSQKKCYIFRPLLPKKGGVETNGIAILVSSVHSNPLRKHAVSMFAVRWTNKVVKHTARTRVVRRWCRDETRNRFVLDLFIRVKSSQMSFLECPSAMSDWYQKKVKETELDLLVNTTRARKEAELSRRSV